MPLPDRPVLLARPRRVRIPRLRRRPGRVRAWVLAHGRELRVTAGCGFAVGSAWVTWGVGAALGAAALSFALMEWLSDDDETPGS